MLLTRTVWMTGDGCCGAEQLRYAQHQHGRAQRSEESVHYRRKPRVLCIGYVGDDAHAC